MNVLDENIPESQRLLLRKRRMRARQIGLDLGRKGMKDREIVRLLHGLDQATFFTLDSDFYNRRLCHEGYCLVYLDVEEDAAGRYVRLLLRHSAFNSQNKRMGCVIRVSPVGLAVWRIHETQERRLSWD
jgi:hypothetical protein